MDAMIKWPRGRRIWACEFLGRAVSPIVGDQLTSCFSFVANFLSQLRLFPTACRSCNWMCASVDDWLGSCFIRSTGVDLETGCARLSNAASAASNSETQLRPVSCSRLCSKSAKVRIVFSAWSLLLGEPGQDGSPHVGFGVSAAESTSLDSGRRFKYVSPPEELGVRGRDVLLSSRVRRFSVSCDIAARAV